MSVSKRLRYEVLRRDNHACRYCGAPAPMVALVVDHVIPTALGGTDLPANLVAACSGCNSGKSATPVDAPLIADVAADAARWGVAMRAAGEVLRADWDRREMIRNYFWDAWTSRSGESSDFDLPDNYGATIDTLTAASHEQLDYEDLCEITWAAPRRDPWRYFCGVAWNTVSRLQQDASSRLAVDGD